MAVTFNKADLYDKKSDQYPSSEFKTGDYILAGGIELYQVNQVAQETLDATFVSQIVADTGLTGPTGPTGPRSSAFFRIKQQEG